MTRNVIKRDFRAPKMAADSHFVKKNRKTFAYVSQIVRNVLESDIWSHKIITGSHSVKKITISCMIALKRREMRSNALFQSAKIATGCELI